MTDTSAGEPSPPPDVRNSDWDCEETRDAVEYDDDTGTYRTTFDSHTDSVTTAIISTVAAVSRTSPMELPSLYSAVDPDALDALVTSAVSDGSTGDVHVTFTLDDHEVTVHSYGTIVVREPYDADNV